jgi:hypothetical protein
MSRTKEGRDALRSSQAHPQARSIAPPWPKRSQGRVPIGRHRPKSEENGEAHPAPGANLRHMRRRARIPPADCRRNRCPLSSAEGVLQHNPSTPAGRFAQIAAIHRASVNFLSILSRSVPEHINAVMGEVGLDKWGFAGKLSSEWRKQSERNEGDEGAKSACGRQGRSEEGNARCLPPVHMISPTFMWS